MNKLKSSSLVDSPIKFSKVKKIANKSPEKRKDEVLPVKNKASRSLEKRFMHDFPTQPDTPMDCKSKTLENSKNFRKTLQCIDK
jgi:hypothetical protein